MSSIPRGPHRDDAAEPPTPGANLPRPSLDQTLVGVAPTTQPTPTPTAAPAESAAEDVRETEPPITPAQSEPIVATPMIAVSGGASQQRLDEPAAHVGGSGVHGADADPGLQSTALASDHLQAARDAALRKLSVPRPRRSVPPAAREEPSPATLPAVGDGPPREPTNMVATQGPSAASPRSMGTQVSVAPPLEPEGAPEAGSPLPPNVEPSGASSTQASAPAQPPFRRFEPVPTVRAPLWEQAPPSVGRPLPLEGAGSDWAPLQSVASSRDTSTPERSGWYRIRWLALAAAALAAIAFAVFGERLTGAPEGRVKLADTVSTPATTAAANATAANATAPEQARLANHPANAPAAAPVVAVERQAAVPAASVASAAGAPEADESAPIPSIAPANDTPAAATSKSVAASKAKKKPVKRSKAKRKRAATVATEPAAAAAEPPTAAAEPAPAAAEPAPADAK